jgi:predicted ester cyclase
MSAEENKALVRAFYDTHHPDRLAQGDAMVTDDFKAYGLGPSALGQEDFKQVGAMFFTAFSDIEQTIEDQVAEGNTVVSRGTWQGTHTGELQSIAPTGRRIAMTWMGLDRVRDGKMAEHWAQLDILGLLQQLGAIPVPEGAGA